MWRIAHFHHRENTEIEPEWKEKHNGRVGKRAVRGGRDHGEEVFVARAKHDGDLIPGKVIPENHVCYVAWGGEEHEKHEYEVLQDPDRYEWVPCHGRHFPHDAVPGGHTADGETLYIARAEHEGTLAIGKLHPTHDCCYIPYGGHEHAYHDFEVLVFK